MSPDAPFPWQRDVFSCPDPDTFPQPWNQNRQQGCAVKRCGGFDTQIEPDFAENSLLPRMVCVRMLGKSSSTATPFRRKFVSFRYRSRPLTADNSSEASGCPWVLESAMGVHHPRQESESLRCLPTNPRPGPAPWRRQEFRGTASKAPCGAEGELLLFSTASTEMHRSRHAGRSPSAACAPPAHPCLPARGQPNAPTERKPHCAPPRTRNALGQKRPSGPCYALCRVPR